MSADIQTTTTTELSSDIAVTSMDIDSEANGDVADVAKATATPSSPETITENPISVDNIEMKTSPTAYSFSGSVLNNSDTNNINSAGNSESKTQNGNANGNGNGNDNESGDSIYECNICLETAKDAVVSMCGHLYCWPCLHQWLETRPNRKLCPVCKAVIGRDKVIPLYGRNSSRQEDPRNKVPPRPASQRTEPEPQQGFQGFGFMDGFHLSFGIGAFPFGYFASLNFGEPRPVAAARGTAQYEDEQQLSKLFLYVAIMCIAWLLFA